MRLEQVRLRNFRLLRRFAIDLTPERTTTVLVGPNNSGKTSVMEGLRLFLGPPSEARKKLCIHDISHLRRRAFGHIQARLEAAADDEQRIAILRRYAPRIRMDLIFSYSEEAADIAIASELLMDLDPENNLVALRIEFGIDNAKALLTDFRARRQSDETLIQFLTGRLSEYYGLSYFKISAQGEEAVSLESGDIIRRLIKIDFISAQRHIDDDENSRSAKLSRLLHDHYNRYYKTEDIAGYNSIEDAIKASAVDLTTRYEGAFGRLTKRLKSFGYPQGHSSPDLKVKAEMNAETVYRDNTRVSYASEHVRMDGEKELFMLPEKYNGLGYKNLIYIVLQLESFRAALEAQPTDRPRVHIIAIEEPEAHLHPQMQCVFIKEISKVLATGIGSTAQVILSTHSSHMVADSGFDPIRYFRRRGSEVSVRDLSQLHPMDEKVLPFLKRYVKLTHCDLFFADKAILVEGQVERLLLPLMIEKCADREPCVHLTNEYISISEVGGAYAHKFKPLIDFLGIPTLIITDLDSVGADGKKCPVASGLRTSNAALKDWLPAKGMIVELSAAGAEDKTQGPICVAYQTAEHGYCGRSFEEAFIYANLDWFSANHGKLLATGGVIGKAAVAGLAASAYEVSAKLPKVDFALDLLTLDGWSIPQYISEGLEWLGRRGAA